MSATVVRWFASACTSMINTGMSRTLHFLYHELRTEPSRYSYVVPCAVFESHCAIFARLRADSGEGWLRPEVTFDDGNRSDLLFARPVLDRHGLRATFFITAAWTGQRAGYMDWRELRELSSAGHQIGAHGLTHKLLTACSPRELSEELRTSKLLLEDGLGIPITTMSLPGGRANTRVFRACEEAGYTRVYTSVPRPVDLSDSPRTIGRLNLTGTATLPWIERVLDPKSGELQKLERVDQVKSFAKAVLGDRLYARLWAFGNRQEAEADRAEAVPS